MAEEYYTRIAQLKDAGAFRAYVRRLGVEMPCDDEALSAAGGSPLAQPADVGGFVVGNRWCVQPMEGWDGTASGEPTETVVRRWQHFGLSGAKLIWGGEAFAVQGDGRANPNQLGIVDGDLARAERGLALLMKALLDAHREAAGRTDDLLVGLQLTHSGRFCRPHEKTRPEPMIAYHHPLLDARVGVKPDDDSAIVSDDYLKRLVDSYVAAARIAQRVGFHFVDVKACHGYLGHEMLSAYTRKGPFGGGFENRTRLLRLIIEGIRAACPGLRIGVRLSAFDFPPFRPDPARSAPGRPGPGIPEDYRRHLPYVYAFGCDVNDPLRVDLTEPIALVRMLRDMGVRLINLTCGSPYYNPHIQRPALFPPSDAYRPPEDPLIGVARQMNMVRRIRSAVPECFFVGSGLTYLQEYVPRVAQAAVRDGWMDFAGIGRMVLAYWDMPLDVLAGRPLQTRRICRTFSDCTTAPRNGMISGCYPLDPFYRQRPENETLKQLKSAGGR